MILELARERLAKSASRERGADTETGAMHMKKSLILCLFLALFAVPALADDDEGDGRTNGGNTTGAAVDEGGSHSGDQAE